MQKSVNILYGQKNINDFIKEQNHIIFDEENWINKELWKIAEVTYSYEKETKVNTTLFVSSWLLDIQKYKTSHEHEKVQLLLKAKTNLEKNLLEKINQINSALLEIEKFDENDLKEEEIELKNIFINSLIEKKKFMEYALIAIPFELDKAWIETWICDIEKEDIEKKLSELDSELFWWMIKDNPLEVKICFDYIYNKYLEKTDVFNDKEKKDLIIF